MYKAFAPEDELLSHLANILTETRPTRYSGLEAGERVIWHGEACPDQVHLDYEDQRDFLHYMGGIKLRTVVVLLGVLVGTIAAVWIGALFGIPQPLGLGEATAFTSILVVMLLAGAKSVLDPETQADIAARTVACGRLYVTNKRIFALDESGRYIFSETRGCPVAVRVGAREGAICFDLDTGTGAAELRGLGDPQAACAEIADRLRRFRTHAGSCTLEAGVEGPPA